MLNRLERTRRGWLLAVAASAAAMFAVPLAASAQNTSGGVGVDVVGLSQPVPRMIQELLELDALRALDEEKRKTQAGIGRGGEIAGFGPPASQAAQPASETASIATPPRLVAITGVGSQLVVAVDQAGRRAHYRSGRAEPVAGADLGLRLQGVSQPCASFVDQSQDVVTYCLNGESP